MKKLLHAFLISATLFISCSLSAQTGYNMVNGGTISGACGGIFYDSGGPSGNYLNNQNLTETFCAPAGQYITFTFTSFTTENTYEHLNIYNGSSTGSPLIGSYTGSGSPGTVTSTLGGCITFSFTSDGSVTYAGWAANISCSSTPPPPVPNTCATANPFCTASGVTYPATTGATAPVGPNYGCLGSEPNPAFFYLEIATAGTINIDISQTSASGSGQDVDFICWGPFSSPAAGCASGLTGSAVDCSYSTSASETCTIASAAVGDFYILMVTNYANAPGTISATTGVGSTGSTNCAILCNMTGLTGVPSACAPATNTYSVTGQITLSYPPTSGTLTVTSSCGGSTTIPLPWTSPITYTLPGLTPTGGACTITATFSADPTCSLTIPYNSPVPCTSCTATATNTGPYCAGATIQLNATGGGTYSWAGPGGFTSNLQNPTRPAATTAMSGTYTVTVTSGATTCTAATTVTVNPSPITTVNSPTICAGGTATLTGAGATSYSWSTGDVTNPITVTPATTTSYTVTGTSLGCTSTAVATVSFSAAVVPTVNSVTICAGATATLTAAGASTYTWTAGATSTGITTADVTPATTTSYTVTGTSGTCTGTAVATVTVDPSPITTVTSPSICAGATATLTAAGATSYTWSSGATPTTTSDADVTPATTTSYTVTGTTGSCTSTAVATVTVNPIPVTTVNSTSICPGGTATLTAAGATSYAWSTGDLTNPISVSPAATTSYTVTGTSLGCSSTAVATVTMNALLVVDAGADDSICYGMTANLAVTPNGAGYVYAWTPAATLSGGGTIFNPTASPSATTTYSVTVTDPSGCTGTDAVTIFADPQITIAIAGIDVTCNGACNGQTIVIPGGGTTAYTYNWSSGCTAAACNSLCPGTYSVTVTDAWGCNVTSSTSVAEPTVLTASVTASTPTTCNALCDGTATAAGAGGTIGPGYSYSWNTSPVQTTPTATGLCAGTYTCTITDANFCTATATVTITQPTVVVTAPIAAVAICNGGTATLTAAASGGNTGGYTYLWAPAGTGTTAAVTVTPATTTTYTVTASDSLHACPAAPVTVTVTVNPPITVIANGTTSICPGVSTAISATASLGTGGPYTYTWAPAAVGTGSPVNVSPAGTTTYTVTANDGCSPPATATVTVTVLPLPVVNFTANVTSGCAPLCVNFSDNSTVTGGTINTWAWTFDGVTANTANPSHCFTTPGSYTVTLTVTSSLGDCTSSSTQTNMITVYPNPVASFTAPQSASIVDPVINFTDNSSNATAWNWNFGDPQATSDSVSSLQNPSHSYPEVGNYCVTLTVTSANGCTDVTQNCLTIDGEFTFFIPNAFSPNGDGINDEFFGKGNFIHTFEMKIFDRWGNLIFYADDITKHWDGKANKGTQIVQEDVYVYTVVIRDNKENIHKFIGTVTIAK